jgi:hypothetical protein
MPPRSLLAFPLLLCLVACRAPDPRQELELRGLETYWAVDPSRGETRYLAPVVRFSLHNKGGQPQQSIQATATFRRKGEESLTWGSDWKQVTPSSKPLMAGQDVPVELKSDARYYSTGPPASMFEHKLFKDATVEVFVRIGASAWTKLAAADVERRIGSKTVQTGG